jgi:ficolin
MKNGGWTVIQRRLDGSENFYRIWKDYVCGFGNRSGEYWLGLENIYRLTTIDSSLRIEMEAFEDVSPSHAYAQYDTFKVDDEDSNFRLHVNGFSGNCDDSLRIHDGNMFSTKDRDNDVWPDNCAQRFGGAWWYEACHHSNLNGLYLSGYYKTYADGINWETCWGHYYSIRSVVMKVKRNLA